jgi:signal transduction histidine kinase/CheY-like chemotaxis protein
VVSSTERNMFLDFAGDDLQREYIAVVHTPKNREVSRYMGFMAAVVLIVLGVRSEVGRDEMGAMYWPVCVLPPVLILCVAARAARADKTMRSRVVALVSMAFLLYGYFGIRIVIGLNATLASFEVQKVNQSASFKALADRVAYNELSGGNLEHAGFSLVLLYFATFMDIRFKHAVAYAAVALLSKVCLYAAMIGYGILRLKLPAILGGMVLLLTLFGAVLSGLRRQEHKQQADFLHRRQLAHENEAYTYSVMLANAPSLAVDDDLLITMWNDKLAAITGWREDQVLGLSVLSLALCPPGQADLGGGGGGGGGGGNDSEGGVGGDVGGDGADDGDGGGGSAGDAKRRRVWRRLLRGEEVGTFEVAFLVSAAGARSPRGSGESRRGSFGAEAGQRLNELIGPPDAGHPVQVVILFNGQAMGSGALCVGTDISEQKQHQRVQRQFLASVSHELRTPLAVIMGMLQLLVVKFEAGIPPQALHYISRANSSAALLLALINDLLDITKAEAGQLALNAAPFSVRDAVRGAAQLLTQQAQAKRLRLVVEVSEHVPQQWTSDTVRLQQILINLLSNGIKFTEEGAITLRVSLTTVAAAAAAAASAAASAAAATAAAAVPFLAQTAAPADDGASPTTTVPFHQNLRHRKHAARGPSAMTSRGSAAAAALTASAAAAAASATAVTAAAGCKLALQFTVTDTGVGIHAAALPKLFQLFSKLPDQRVRNPAGSGLGLAIVKNLVALLRGKVSASSVYGQGTAMTFTIANYARANQTAPFTSAELELSGFGASSSTTSVSAGKSKSRAVAGAKSTPGFETLTLNDGSSSSTTNTPTLNDGSSSSTSTSDSFDLDRTTPRPPPPSTGAPTPPAGAARAVYRAPAEHANDMGGYPPGAGEGTQRLRRAGLRVLLAEDSPFNAEVVVAMLEGIAPREVVWASDGQQAVEAYVRYGHCTQAASSKRWSTQVNGRTNTWRHICACAVRCVRLTGCPLPLYCPLSIAHCPAVCRCTLLVFWCRAAESGMPFDVVLMDIGMPVLNGQEATMQIRKWEGVQRSKWEGVQRSRKWEGVQRSRPVSLSTEKLAVAVGPEPEQEAEVEAEVEAARILRERESTLRERESILRECYGGGEGAVAVEAEAEVPHQPPVAAAAAAAAAVAACHAVAGTRTRTPIIALTALGAPADVARCVKAGMDAVLTKPCTIEDLFEGIDQATRQAAGGGHSGGANGANSAAPAGAASSSGLSLGKPTALQLPALGPSAVPPVRAAPVSVAVTAEQGTASDISEGELCAVLDEFALWSK